MEGIEIKIDLNNSIKNINQKEDMTNTEILFLSTPPFLHIIKHYTNHDTTNTRLKVLTYLFSIV